MAENELVLGFLFFLFLQQRTANGKNVMCQLEMDFGNKPLCTFIFLSPFPLFSLLLVHSKNKNRQTCVRKSLICAFAMAFIISVMLIAANQMLRNGME